MAYPESILQLIESFARLPGVGKRTAERFALYILSAAPEQVDEMARLLLKVNGHIHSCQICFNLSEDKICHICADASRDHTLLCVVQEPKDVIAVEKSGDFSGVYHVLMGALSPLEGIGPKDIRIKELFQRLKGRKEESLTVQLYNFLFDKTKLEKGYHSLSEPQMQKKLEELQEEIERLSKRLPPSQFTIVQDQINALEDEEFED